MKQTAVLLLALLVSGCASSFAQPAHPAVIVHPTEASRKELLSIVRDALNHSSLTLAATALTQDSMLLVDRVPRYDARGLPVEGRIRDMPDRFLLSIESGRCVLTYERTQQRWWLRHTRCMALM